MGMMSPKKVTKHQRRLWRQGERKRLAAEKAERERLAAEKAKKERWKAERERAAAKKKQEIERLKRILGLSDEWPTPEFKEWLEEMRRQKFYPSVDEYFRHWFCNKRGRVANKAASIARLLQMRGPYYGSYWSERTNGEVKSLGMFELQKILNPYHPYRDD